MSTAAFNRMLAAAGFTAEDPQELKDISVLLYGGAGSGKGHPYGTPILTDHGWVPIEDLNVGDYLIGSRGEPRRLYGVWDRGVLPVYEFTFDDGASVEVDAEHLWTVRSSKGTWITVPTQNFLPRLEGKEGMRCDFPVLHRPAVLNDRDLPLPPYMLGGLLADGYLPEQGTVTWTKNDQSVIDEMARQAARAGYTLVETTQKGSTARNFRFVHLRDETHHSVLRAVLRDLGLLGLKSRNKFIPPEYLTASVEQRRELLAGLMDGDGSVRKDRERARYSTSSERLAQGVQELAWSLRYRARQSWAVPPSRSRLPYKKVTMWDGDSPFLASEWGSRSLKNSPYAHRKLASVRVAGEKPVRCLAVAAADQLYVAKDYILTHNTSLSATASKVPEMSPVLYLDFERGTLPLRDWGDLDNLTIVHLDSWAETNKFIYQVVRPAMQAGSFPYRTVVLDTVDALQELIVNESKAANPGNNYVPWTDAYDNVVTLVDAFRRVDGVNLIVITHVDRMTNSVTGETQVGPAFKGNQSGKHMPSKFDFVAYMRSGEDKGRPVMGATFFMPGAITKRRTRSFPDHLINPTMAQIWSLAHNTNTDKETS